MVELKNYAKPIEERGRQQYYRWKLFLEGDEDELASIERVEYQLHPTFPKPEKTRTNREDGFALESAGWGEFSVLAEVVYADGHSETVGYWLELGDHWPEGDEDHPA